jgi:hypothetical protein
MVQVKALACEPPHRLQLPLSRLSLSEIRREVITKPAAASSRRWLLRVVVPPRVVRPVWHRTRHCHEEFFLPASAGDKSTQCQ